MADGCDDPRQIDDLARLVDRGVAVAAASRYMPGGQQVGGPGAQGAAVEDGGPLAAAPRAHRARRDATNSFKAYSTEFVRAVGIDSRDGFEIGIELTAKARRMRLPVAEIPTIWLDRQAGVSNFRVAKWIPGYLRWYRFAFGPRLTAEQVRAYGQRVRKETGQYEDAEGSGQRVRWLHRRLRRRGAARPGRTSVVGIDNYSKYGKVVKSYDGHPNYHFVEGDARDAGADDARCCPTATTSSPARR